MSRIAPRTRAWRGLWAAASFYCALTVTTDAASQKTPPRCEPAVLNLIEAADLLRIDTAELERLAEEQKLPARRVGSSWRFNCAALMAWLNGDWELITAAVAPRAAGLSTVVAREAGAPLTTVEMARVTASGTAIARGTTAPSATPPSDRQDKPIGEAPKGRTAEDVFLRGQRVLLGRGGVVVDIGQFYSRSDNVELASVRGLPGLVTIEQETSTTLLQGRLGILNETELFAGTTYHSQDSDVFLGSTHLASSRRTEFGDVSVGIRRTFLKEGVHRPNIIATLDARLPTGHDSYAAGGGLVLVKSVDPVVLFSSVHYSHTFDRNSARVTRLEPEARVNVSVGYGLALNDTLAISTIFSGLFSGDTTSDNATFRQPALFSGRFGLTSRLTQHLYIEPSVSFALNGPRGSFAMGVTLPYAF